MCVCVCTCMRVSFLYNTEALAVSLRIHGGTELAAPAARARTGGAVACRRAVPLSSRCGRGCADGVPVPVGGARQVGGWEHCRGSDTCVHVVS